MFETPSQVHRGVLVSVIAHFDAISKGTMQLGLSSSHVLSGGDLKLSEIVVKVIKKASLGACGHFWEPISTFPVVKGTHHRNFVISSLP